MVSIDCTGVMNVSDEEELVRAVWALLQFPSQMRRHQSLSTGILAFSAMNSRASCCLGTTLDSSPQSLGTASQRTLASVAFSAYM